MFLKFFEPKVISASMLSFNNEVSYLIFSDLTALSDSVSNGNTTNDSLETENTSTEDGGEASVELAPVED